MRAYVESDMVDYTLMIGKPDSAGFVLRCAIAVRIFIIDDEGSLHIDSDGCWRLCSCLQRRLAAFHILDLSLSKAFNRAGAESRPANIGKISSSARAGLMSSPSPPVSASFAACKDSVSGANCRCHFKYGPERGLLPISTSYLRKMTCVRSSLKLAAERTALLHTGKGTRSLGTWKVLSGGW